MGQVSRVIAINANAGAFTVIRCTRTSSRMLIFEDGSQNGGFQQGLSYQLLTPNSADAPNAWTAGPTVNVAPNLSLEPILIAGYEGDHPPNAVPIGTGGSYPYPCAPGGPVTHGTPIVQIKSLALATSIVVTEEF